MSVQSGLDRSKSLTEAARQLYLENLLFRRNMFNANTSHMSIAWPEPEKEITRNEFNHKADGQTDNSIPLLNLNDDLNKTIEEQQTPISFEPEDLIIKNKHFQQPSFVNFAIGSSSNEVGRKLTFNVKSKSDVNPSAIRALINRKKEQLKTNSEKAKLRTENLLKESIGTLNFTSKLNKVDYCSEYTSQYPVYDDRFYSMAAKTTAGRSRLPDGRLATENCYSSNINKRSFVPLRSVMPDYPVLLSARSITSHY